MSFDAHNKPNIIYNNRLLLFPGEETQGIERWSNVSKSHSGAVIEAGMQQSRHPEQWGNIPEGVGQGSWPCQRPPSLYPHAIEPPGQPVSSPHGGPIRKASAPDLDIIIYTMACATMELY